MIVPAALLVLSLQEATAPHAAAVLAVAESSTSASCLRVDELRAGVSARLGYDPFLLATQDAVRIAISQSERAGMYTATVEMSGADSTRKRMVNASTCVSLASNVELVVALAIDTMSAGDPPAPIAMSEPAVSERPTPAVTVPPSEVHPPSGSGAPARWSLTGGASAEFGTLPSASYALRMGVTRVQQHASLGAELYATGLVTESGAEGDYNARCMGGTLLAGYDSARAEPFAVSWSLHLAVSLGALQVAALGVPEAASATHLALGIGPRMSVAIPLGGAFALQPFAEITASPLRSEFTLRGSGATRDALLWQSSGASVRAGLALRLQIL